jgi:hypothetical protein
MPQLNQTKNASDEMTSAASTAFKQAETLTRAQCELLSGIEAISRRLMQWQREAIDASARSLSDIAESRDLGNVLQIQQQWIAGAAQRTASNWSELMNEAATLTWRVTRIDRASEQSQSSTPTAPGQPEEQTQRDRQAAK